MKRRKLYSYLLVQFMLWAIWPSSAHSSEIKFPKKVTIDWQSSLNQVYYSPGGNFKIGKQVSKKILDAEVKKSCTRFFGFSHLTARGRSGNLFGSANMKSNNFKYSYTFVNGEWTLDENGEDVYELSYECSGSMNVSIKARSAKYWFRIENLQSKFLQNDLNYFDGGYFPLETLNAANWKLNIVFFENWRINYGFAASQLVWSPEESDGDDD